MKALRVALVSALCLGVTTSGVMAAGHLCVDHHAEVTLHDHGEAHVHEHASHGAPCDGCCSHGADGGRAPTPEGETCGCVYGPVDCTVALPAQSGSPRPSQGARPAVVICHAAAHLPHHLNTPAVHDAGGKNSHLALSCLRTVVLRL